MGVRREADAHVKRLARLAEERKKMDGVKATARRGGGHVASSVSSMLAGCSVLARGLPSSARVCASATGSACARTPVLVAAVAVRASAALPFAVVVPRGKAAKQAAGAAGGFTSRRSRRASLRWGWLPSECDAAAAQGSLHGAPFHLSRSSRRGGGRGPARMHHAARCPVHT